MPVTISTGPKTPATRPFTSAQSTVASAFTHPRYRDRPRVANDGSLTAAGRYLRGDQLDVELRVRFLEVDASCSRAGSPSASRGSAPARSAERRSASAPRPRPTWLTLICAPGGVELTASAARGRRSRSWTLAATPACALTSTVTGCQRSRSMVTVAGPQGTRRAVDRAAPDDGAAPDHLRVFRFGDDAGGAIPGRAAPSRQADARPRRGFSATAAGFSATAAALLGGHRRLLRDRAGAVAAVAGFGAGARGCDGGGGLRLRGGLARRWRWGRGAAGFGARRAHLRFGNGRGRGGGRRRLDDHRHRRGGAACACPNDQ